MGCLLHCTATSGLLTECGACPMYSVRNERNPFRGIPWFCLVPCTASGRRAIASTELVYSWQFKLQSPVCKLLTVFVVLFDMITETEPTHSPNVDTRTIIRAYASESYSERVVRVCVLATTAGVERLFSISGFILSSRRLRLTDKNFEDQVFTHCNANFLGAVCRKRKSAYF